MKKFINYLCEQMLREEEEMSPEFEELIKQAESAYESGEYDKAWEILNSMEAKTGTEQSLKHHFQSMLADKRGDFTKRFEGP